jgi:integrase-like protein
LTVSQFNPVEKTLRIEGDQVKNGEGKEACVSAAAYTFLTQLCAGKKATDAIFVRSDGTVIKDFRFMWRQVCMRAGLGALYCRDCKNEATRKGWRYYCQTCDRFVRRVTLKYRGLFFHDLRRTFAVRCARAGLDASAAMAVAGWKTDSLFRRYAIKTVEQTRTVQARLAAHALEVENRRNSLKLTVSPDELPPVAQPADLVN